MAKEKAVTRKTHPNTRLNLKSTRGINVRREILAIDNQSRSKQSSSHPPSSLEPIKDLSRKHIWNTNKLAGGCVDPFIKLYDPRSEFEELEMQRATSSRSQRER